MNGTAVSGLPGMFPGIPDPRFGFLTPQQQYAIAVEQVVFCIYSIRVHLKKIILDTDEL